MARRIALALFVLVALAGCKSQDVAGTWAPVRAQLAGNEFPIAAFDGGRLHLTSSTYEFAGDKGTVAIVSMKAPAKMDIHGIEGPNAGKDIPAIFALAGDSLTICYQLGAGPRPTAFVSPAGSKVLLITYARESAR